MSIKTNYILAATSIVLSFVIFNSAFAAKTVPGQVPVLPPLQTALPDTRPNVSGNIQNQTKGFGADTASGQESGETKNPAADSFVDKASITAITAGANPTPTWIIFILLFLALAAGIGYWLYSRKR